MPTSAEVVPGRRSLDVMTLPAMRPGGFPEECRSAGSASTGAAPGPPVTRAVGGAPLHAAVVKRSLGVSAPPTGLRDASGYRGPPPMVSPT